MIRMTLAAALCAGLASLSSAQPFTEWGTAGGWYIFHNEATGNCAMERVTEQNIALEFALLTEELGDETKQIGALALWLPGTAPETPPDVPFAEVQIGENTYFGESRLVARDDGYWGGYMVTDEQVRMDLDMASADEMTITTYTGDLAYVDLSRTDVEAALSALLTCQADNG